MDDVLHRLHCLSSSSQIRLIVSLFVQAQNVHTSLTLVWCAHVFISFHVSWVELLQFINPVESYNHVVSDVYRRQTNLSSRFAYSNSNLFVFDKHENSAPSAIDWSCQKQSKQNSKNNFFFSIFTGFMSKHCFTVGNYYMLPDTCNKICVDDCSSLQKSNCLCLVWLKCLALLS